MANDIKENLYFLKRNGAVLTVFSTGINTLYAISPGDMKNVIFELYDNEKKQTITRKTINLNELSEETIKDLESKAKYYC